MNKLSITTLALSLLLFTGSIAEAQTARARIADTPIRREANLESAIIATLKEGAPLDVGDLQGGWYRVLVPNEQGKPLVGFVPADLIQIVDADASPQSILAPSTAAALPAAEGPPIAPSLAQLAVQRDKAIEREQVLKALALERDKAVERELALRAQVDVLQGDRAAPRSDQPIREVPSSRIRQPVAPHPRAREGLWFNGGLGFGSLCFGECVGRLSGVSGGASFGSTINDRFLLGVGTTGYYRSADGGALTARTLDARLRFYPVRKSGFFLTGGLGLGQISNTIVTEYGLGVVLGVGWDVRIRSNLSLTPFWNGIGVSTSNRSAGVGQLGLGITVH